METNKSSIPFSDANREWLENVQDAAVPASKRQGRYNLVVVGGGPAGLVAAASAAGLGAKVALIESDKMGGDCLNVGCVPSKSLLQSARKHDTLARASTRDGESRPAPDFGSITEELQRTRARLSHHDSVKRFRELGVDVFLGHGSFTGRQSIAVNDEVLHFRKAVIATGAKAAPLTITGSQSTELLTNDTLFNLTQQPKRLIVVGGGAIGCEMSQAFAKLGTRVLQIERTDRLLGREDADASAVLHQSLERDGVKILLNSTVKSVSEVNQEKQLKIIHEGSERVETADHILVCVGRISNVQNIGLDNAEVAFDGKTGIEVNDFLQTSNPNIYAAGDVTNLERFTHAADFMARIVIQNALFMGRRRYSSLVIPRSTYTSPEIAHVGVSSETAAENPEKFTTLTVPFDLVDRAVIDHECEGFVRVHVKRGSDEILGATIVNAHAGELISNITLAMTHKIGLKKIASTIFPYPTQADAIRKVGDQYNRSRLTPFVKKLFKGWLDWNC